MYGFICQYGLAAATKLLKTAVTPENTDGDRFASWLALYRWINSTGLKTKCMIKRSTVVYRVPMAIGIWLQETFQ